MQQAETECVCSQLTHNRLKTFISYRFLWSLDKMAFILNLFLPQWQSLLSVQQDVACGMIWLFDDVHFLGINCEKRPKIIESAYVSHYTLKLPLITWHQQNSFAKLFESLETTCTVQIN